MEHETEEYKMETIGEIAVILYVLIIPMWLIIDSGRIDRLKEEVENLKKETEE